MLYRTRMVREYCCTKCDFTSIDEETMKKHLCSHLGIESVSILDEYIALQCAAERATYERCNSQNEKTIAYEDEVYRRLEAFEKEHNIRVE